MLGAAAGAVLTGGAFPRRSAAAAEVRLRDLAEQKGLLFGTAVLTSRLKDAAYAQLVAQQCDLLVAEGEMKWNVVRPTPQSFNFGPGDELLDFAQKHDMKLRGHNLLWHESLPEWVNDVADDPKKMRDAVVTHIRTVVKHYAGKLQSWDVINEVMDPSSRRPDGLRDSIWLWALGPDYPELVFRTAAEADSKTLLVWNENHLEFDDSYCDAKRTAWLRLLEKYRKQGVRIGAIGIQSHLDGDRIAELAGQKFLTFLRNVSDLGLKILITEMDVPDFALAGDPAKRDQQVADVYRKYLSAVLENRSVIAVLTWGLADKYSWLQKYKPRADKQASRPLPFDPDLHPTAAFEAIADAFRHAPRR
jgi:endo-1,4-beta-xylanase